jgi:hypothetical protein
MFNGWVRIDGVDDMRFVGYWKGVMGVDVKRGDESLFALNVCIALCFLFRTFV